MTYAQLAQRPAARPTAKQAVNVTVDAQLLAEAKALGIPLSSTLEEALRVRVREARQVSWLAENRDALDDYNARIESDGVFGEQFGNI